MRRIGQEQGCRSLGVVAARRTGPEEAGSCIGLEADCCTMDGYCIAVGEEHRMLIVAAANHNRKLALHRNLYVPKHQRLSFAL